MMSVRLLPPQVGTSVRLMPPQVGTNERAHAEQGSSFV